jgi:Flp pilus assembly pilin Flp
MSEPLLRLKFPEQNADGNGIMQTILNVIAQLESERGQTMAEYGILIAVIALVVVVVAVTLGSSIAHLFGSAASHL